MSRHDRHAEREWQRQMAERDAFYSWDTEMPKIPRTDHEETIYLLVIVGVVSVAALIGLIVWGVVR